MQSVLALYLNTYLGDLGLQQAVQAILIVYKNLLQGLNKGHATISEIRNTGVQNACSKDLQVPEFQIMNYIEVTRKQSFQDHWHPTLMQSHQAIQRRVFSSVLAATGVFNPTRMYINKEGLHQCSPLYTLFLTGIFASLVSRKSLGCQNCYP